LIIGLPVGLSGREGPQAAEVRHYADQVATAIGEGVAIEFWDERLSSTIAERTLIQAGTRRDRRRERIDAVAAAIILQGWLDAGRHRRGALRSL
jgi:putative Holliday junction resolvase